LSGQIDIIKKMKILYASETYLPTVNGAAIFTHKLAKEMARRGHEVSVITISSDFRNHAQKEDGVTTYRLRSFSTILKPSQRMGPFNRANINKLVREIWPDIVHIQNHLFIGAPAVDAANRLKIPVIGTNHMGPGDISCFLPLPGFIKKVVDLIMWKHLGSVFKKCSYLTAPSRFVFDLFAKYGADRPGGVISNGMDLNMFRPKRSGEGTMLRSKYSLPDKPIVLYAGRLDPGKEMEVWIRAIPYVLEKTEAHFVTVGPGTRKKSLKRLAKELGIDKNITFIDSVPYAEMPDYYRLADLFAISSVMESQSLTVLEAMASGLPLVATNFTALPELVHDGENGFLFEAGDSRMMADKIIKILSDPALAKNMGQRSLEFVKDHADQKTFDAFEATYKRLAITTAKA
jgi:glycosyltransferase involved in cell wall biosynthesis